MHLLALVRVMSTDFFYRRCFLSSHQVRDRATLYLNALGGDGQESVASAEGGAESFMLETLAVPLGNLEAALHAYVSEEVNV